MGKIHYLVLPQPEGLSLRPSSEADLPLLFAIYASTRQEEMLWTGWGQEQQTAFLRSQFQAQHDDYRKNYPKARFELIERQGIPVGRLYTERRSRELRIIDLALLPEFRRQGIGTLLLRWLQSTCAVTGKLLTLQVFRFNPALELYRRLGFLPLPTREDELYLKMSWRSPT